MTVRPKSLTAVALALAFLAACTSDDGVDAAPAASTGSTGSTGTTATTGTSTPSVTPDLNPDVGVLPDEAREIMEKAPYGSARWIYYVADADSGEVLLADRADEMVFTGSTAKNFVVGAAYDVLGADTTLTTPVFSTTAVVGGAVTGDLVLVASGDLALGGRNALEGRFDHTFNADTVDHVYANIAPNAARIGDPLAGLDDLAGQIADKGVSRIDGDVVIDTRIWETFQGQEGPTPPIYVNDNILDIQVTGAAEGEAATLELTPQTEFLSVEADVKTVAADDKTALAVEPSADDPNRVIVSGTIAQGTSQLTIHRVDDSSAWARALFIEALERAGIEVAAPVIAPNDETDLPAAGSYPAAQQLASLQSPSLSAMGTMILETSYNTGANAFLCLLAVDLGSTDCTAGLPTMYDLATEAGVDTDSLFLIDGQGADPASTSPRQMARWVQWAREQPWGDAFVEGQPVLAETGSLAPYGAGSPAAGKVAAKAGTSVGLDPVTERLYSKVQSLGGYLTLDDGRVLVFGLSMSGATYPTLFEGLVEAGTDVAGVAAAFQQALS